MTETEALRLVKKTGVIPAIRTSNPGDGVDAAAAIAKGGIPIVEISLALENGLAVLDAVAKANSLEGLVGAGSVLDAASVQRAVDAGARFIVSPGFDLPSIQKANALNIAIFVGALTPTEVQLAHSSGATAVKLFPCYATGGPRYVRSLKGQYPKVHFIASGGVGLENCAEYFRAGACAIGVGGEIADAESMAAGAHRVFTVRAKRMREAIERFIAWRASEEAEETINVGEDR